MTLGLFNIIWFASGLIGGILWLVFNYMSNDCVTGKVLIEAFYFLLGGIFGLAILMLAIVYVSINRLISTIRTNINFDAFLSKEFFRKKK